MNKYLKIFLHRGLMFAGFGPIICGIVYAIVTATTNDFSLNGYQLLIAIISTYLLAFVQAGASIFNQIDEWPITKSIACHLSCIYIAYIACYLVNSWIPFDWTVIVIFTVIFVVVYAIIWLTIYLISKKTSKALNSKI